MSCAPGGHRIRTWNRRDSRALGETSLFVSASVTVVEPAPLARKTTLLGSWAATEDRDASADHALHDS